MCGILGVAYHDGHLPDLKHWQDALDVLAHRGPDGKSTYAKNKCMLGHQRLAVFDTSLHGMQPMTRGDLTIVFNGAIYNFWELRKELTALGYTFTSQSDTEVIIYAYQAWGENCVKRFNGMWAFVILEEGNQLLFGSRDRYGIKPFYLTKNTNGLVFSSEIKAIRKLLNMSKLNYTRTWEYLAFGWHDHTSKTFFEDIEQLPAGHNFKYSIHTNQYIQTSYYQLPDTTLNKKDISLREAIDGVYERLNQSVMLRTRSDVPWGLTLSGGLDSSSIASLLRNQLANKHEIHAFSAIFKEPEISEARYVNAVVEKHKLKLHSLEPGWSLFLDDLDEVLNCQDEPIASSAVVGHFTLMKVIRKAGFKVILNGQGADEVLAGYDKFFLPYLKEGYKTNLFRTPVDLFYILYRRQFSLSKAMTRTLNYGKQNKENLPWMKAYLDPNSSIFQRSSDENIRSCSQNLIRGIGLPILLHYEDRNAMSQGIETRVPFLDHELVDFAMQLPSAYKIRKGQRKYLLRQAMKEVLPPLVKNRYKKLGFATPQQKWMDEHPDYFLQLIATSQMRCPLLFSNDLIAWAEKILSQKTYLHYSTLWRIAVFCRWAELNELSCIDGKTV